MVSADPQRTHGPDYEKNYYESLLIVLDTLEKCLSGQPKDTTRFDEAMNVKLLLREICQFIGRNGRVFFHRTGDLYSVSHRLFGDQVSVLSFAGGSLYRFLFAQTCTMKTPWSAS